MKSVYDVRMLLRRFGMFVYTRDRMGDLILMESELEELYKMDLILQEEYLSGKLILQQERNLLQQQERRHKN